MTVKFCSTESKMGLEAAQRLVEMHSYRGLELGSQHLYQAAPGDPMPLASKGTHTHMYTSILKKKKDHYFTNL